MNAGIKFDSISFTFPRNYNADTLSTAIPELFGIDFNRFQLKERKRNYYKRSYLLAGPNGDKLIEVFTDPDTEGNRNTTLFQITGFALSAYVGNPLSIDVPELFRRIAAHGGKPTVLHIAMDDTIGQLPWNSILEMVRRENYREHTVSTSRRMPNMLNNETVYFGKQGDRTSLILYRKDVKEGTKFPWIRVEYRTKVRATAKAIADKVAAGEELGPLAAGLIRRALEFKERSIKTKYNRPTCQWWLDFLGNVEKMIIKRDLAPRRSPVKKQPSIAKIIDALRMGMNNNPAPEAYQLLYDFCEEVGLPQIASFGNPAPPITPAGFNAPLIS